MQNTRHANQTTNFTFFLKQQMQEELSLLVNEQHSSNLQSELEEVKRHRKECQDLNDELLLQIETLKQQIEYKKRRETMSFSTLSVDQFQLHHQSLEENEKQQKKKNRESGIVLDDQDLKSPSSSGNWKRMKDGSLKSPSLNSSSSSSTSSKTSSPAVSTPSLVIPVNTTTTLHHQMSQMISCSVSSLNHNKSENLNHEHHHETFSYPLLLLDSHYNSHSNSFQSKSFPSLDSYMRLQHQYQQRKQEKEGDLRRRRKMTIHDHFDPDLKSVWGGKTCSSMSMSVIESLSIDHHHFAPFLFDVCLLYRLINNFLPV